MTGKASNPNQQYLGFENLKAYNNAHPDELHLNWMMNNGLIKPPKERKRGRKPGSNGTCSRCGRKGHYAKTCKHGVDIKGKPLWTMKE